MLLIVRLIMVTFKLDGNFMLGTATSSTQIEGGDRNNTWYKWCEAGHIKDSTSCFTACDHWNRVEQDTRILKSLNVQTHRLSLEWSRLEPAPGQFSAEAMKHYRDELALLLGNNIRPLVTLHHFSEPLWFQALGGWKKPENAELFIAYARHVVENLGDLVSDWVTFNEPNVYVSFGYEAGIYPPGSCDLPAALGVNALLIETHVKLYGLIHQIRDEKKFGGRTMVGAAIHIRVFDGITPPGRLAAAAVDYMFNALCMEGMTTGRLMFPLPGWASGYKKGVYADFLGINYYTRNIVEFALDPSNYFHRLVNDRDLTKTDLGWDIYPKGIYRVCKKYYDKYRLPIFITENGISDRFDDRRPDFIADHLAYLAQAVGEGVEVQRYYHWSVMDNFEWLDGETGNFGLYHTDFKTQERAARKSAALYARICREKGITKGMEEEFDLLYK
jgi:beta-glucosidase